MKTKVSFIAALLLSASLWAQDRPQYAVKNIPDSIRDKSSLIVRLDAEDMVVRQPGKGRSSIKRVVTILGEKGKEGLYFIEHPDQFRKIENVDMNLYDENGKYLRHLKRKDLEKFNDNGEGTLVSDNKVLVGGFTTDKYPVTVEVEYNVDYDGFLEYSDFLSQYPERYIMESRLSITTPLNNKPRYKNYRCNLQPLIKENGNEVTYTWSVKNVPPMEMEDGTASRNYPRVMISPTLFEMDNFLGDMSSWQSFGQWQINLNAQLTKLSPERVAFFRNMVKDARSDEDKVRILYKYLQDNFRYVSIQLGIGGWKPFPADFVDKKKYGDCKALSNYMQAMLNAVNIKSHYAIINAGYDEMPVDKDFPQSSFNHVILCVPQAKDTIWLECTSRTQPFNVLGNFTENRYAFIITDKGGQLVRTPASKAEQNTVSFRSVIQYNANGSGTASIDIVPTGEFSSELNSVLFESEEARKKSYLINKTGFKQPDELKINKTGQGTSGEKIHLDLNYAKLYEFNTGAKYFMNTRLYKVWNTPLPKAEKRETDYYLEFPLIHTDTSQFILPEGFIIESLPKSAQLSSKIGSYESSFSFDPATRTFTSRCVMRINSHIIPAEQYSEASKFITEVMKDQQQKVVLKKS